MQLPDDGRRPADVRASAGRSRRRRRRAGASRRQLAVVFGTAAVILVAVAVAVAVGLGGGPSTSAARAPASLFPSAPPAASPAPTVTATSATPASPSPSLPARGPGVRADRILVPSVDIDLPVVEGDGVDAPLGKAAHYPGTAWPGGGTNIYLYAHARDGMFIGLWDVSVGDEVDLHLVDGTTRAYVVRRILPKVAWNALQYLDPTPGEQLTLQTCTSYQETAPRFLVVAVPRP